VSDEERQAPAWGVVLDERLKTPEPGRPCAHTSVWIEGGNVRCLLCGKALRWCERSDDVGDDDQDRQDEPERGEPAEYPGEDSGG
jgi:hypothetical protein